MSHGNNRDFEFFLLFCLSFISSDRQRFSESILGQGNDKAKSILHLSACVFFVSIGVISKTSLA